MLPHDFCFYGGFAFLIGVAFALLGVPPFFITSAALLCVVFCFVQGYIAHDNWMRGLGICVLFILVGGWYVGIRYEQFNLVEVPYNKTVQFEGCVASESKFSASSREATLRVLKPFIGNIKIRVRDGEQISYGDCVRGMGIIKQPLEASVNYFLKEGLYGTIAYPKFVLTHEWRGSQLKNFMISTKQKIMNTFLTVLPRDEATFLAGLTIGAKGEFPDELVEAFKKSGTTHLVALSGYNIMIVVSFLMLMFVRVLKRRYAVIATMICVFLFTFFAGAESSLVRAAILGCIGMLAGEVGRIYDIRQAVVVAAVGMVLINPFVLIFDIGFQLSFAAFLAIAYCSPALCELFHISDKAGRSTKLVIDSLSAQLATFPIIAMQFGTVSFVGIIATFAVMEFIPFTMAFGFIGAGISLFSTLVAEIPLFLVGILLKFELLLIRFFGSIPMIEWKMNSFIFIIYFALLVTFIWIYLQKRNVRNRIHIVEE
ncbi:MAG: ComEC/Rec2 family competence protein [Candidatus Paceibacterota bacterium]|jgi:competence protein ComEC